MSPISAKRKQANKGRPGPALAQRLAAFESEMGDELTVLNSSAKEIVRALEGLARVANTAHLVVYKASSAKRCRRAETVGRGKLTRT